MKLLALLPIAFLTACATSTDAYYAAIEARENRLAQQQVIADTAITKMAAEGGEQAKGMALMYFALKAAGSKDSQQAIAAPRSFADNLLPWAGVLVPGFTQFYAIQQNARVQTHLSDNSVKSQTSNNSMIVDLVHGRDAPIVGTADDVLIFNPR